MCGVCGWLSLDGSPIDRPVVEAMTSILGHRGPDGDGHHFEERIAFGHRRLAIIDPAAGQQWLGTDDGRRFLTLSSERWCAANVAGGEDPVAAREMADRCLAAYLGEGARR